MTARFINYYHSKYDRFACLTKSRRVPVSRGVYKLLSSSDYGICFTLDGSHYYFVGCFRDVDVDLTVRIRYGKCIKINPPLFFVQYQMKYMPQEIEDKLKFHLSHFCYEV